MYQSLQTGKLKCINYHIDILVILNRVKTEKNRKIVTLEQVSPGIKAKPHHFTNLYTGRIFTTPGVKKQNMVT